MNKPNQRGDEAKETGLAVCGIEVNVYGTKTD
jgi:hypothetical protein